MNALPADTSGSLMPGHDPGTQRRLRWGAGLERCVRKGWVPGVKPVTQPIPTLAGLLFQRRKLLEIS